MFKSTNIRIRGVLIAIGGLFLAGFMGWIGIGLELHAGTIGNPDSVPGYNGSSEMLTVIYVLFAALIALGINFGVIGGWMLVFGKRNRILNWVMWALYFVATIASGFAD